MSVRLTKPWSRLDELDADELPAQLGVFQLADAKEQVVYVGYGGGNRPFGLRTAILESIDGLDQTPALVRWELTQGYLSRWEELIMLHRHEHGGPPAGNDPATAPSGRLRPGD